MAFTVSVIFAADVLYAPASVPVTDHGDKAVAAVPAGKQPGIAVLCAVSGCGTRLLLQPLLYQKPCGFFDDLRVKFLMAQPAIRGDRLRFSVPVFSAMIDQNAGVGFLGQNVFHTGIRPEKLPVSGFVYLPGVMPDLLPQKLRGCFAVQRIEPARIFLLIFFA